MEFATRPELAGTFGMVASTHWAASAAGMAVLELGGNAFDAAVAAGFVLQVVEPHLNGPGGDLPALLWPSGRDEPVVLCAQGPAPARATIAHYRDELGLDLVPGTGPLAAVVPGAFGGWMYMLRDFGTMRLGEVLRFAISYASAGYPVLERLSSAISSVEALFRDEWLTSAEVYLPAPRPGELGRNLALGATYQRVLAEAEAASPGREDQIEAAYHTWYRGWVAEAVVRAQDRAWLDTSGQRHRGVLGEGDLSRWQPTYEAPVSVGYRGLTVYKAGPWSQGPVCLQQLQLLQNFDLAGMGAGSSAAVHTLTECAKLAFADREAWYGDPEFTDVPTGELLSPEYAAERAKLVDATSAPGLRPGRPGGRAPRLPAIPAGESGGPRQAPGRGPGQASGTPAGSRGDTVHLDVADRWGNVVSATPSGGWLTGAPVISELGFCLGTRAQMFWLEDGLPSSLGPGRRPRTTLSPTLCGRDGRAYLAIGTPGGDQQDQWALHALVAHVDFGLDLQQAIDAPNHHTEAFPGSFYPRQSRSRHLAVEARVGPEVIDELRHMGHSVEVAGPWELGRVTAVGRGPGGTLVGGADPRGRQAYVAGR